MPDNNLIRQVFKNYMYSVRASVGSELFRHVYVINKHTQLEQDTLQDGKLACAYFVSCILTLHGLIDKPHSTVRTTLEKMKEAGWTKAKEPVPGAIVYWPSQEEHGHLGFYLGAGECMSNSTSKHVPVQHGLTLSDGREPSAFYVHNALPQPVIH